MVNWNWDPKIDGNKNYSRLPQGYDALPVTHREMLKYNQLMKVDFKELPTISRWNSSEVLRAWLRLNTLRA